MLPSFACFCIFWFSSFVYGAMLYPMQIFRSSKKFFLLPMFFVKNCRISCSFVSLGKLLIWIE